MSTLFKGEFLLGRGLSNKFVEKLIEDTKSDKLKWNRNMTFEAATFGIEEYFTEIEGVGIIKIERSADRFESSPEDVFSFRVGDELEFFVRENDDLEYYTNVSRLYRFAQNSYIKQIKEMPQNINLEKAITAYINAD